MSSTQKHIPIQTLPIVERWDCHSCGNCCRGSIVRLDAADLKRLREQRWDKHPNYQKMPVYVRESWFGGGYRLAQHEDGRCVFLTDDGLCRVHADFGFEEKPLICRTYPLQLVPLEKFSYLTTRRSCPSAACDKGRNINEHRPAITRLMQAGRGVHVATKPPRLTKRHRGSWPDILHVAGAIERLLIDDRFPMVRRLVHGLQFCDLFEQCIFKKLEQNRLAELVQLLESSCLADAGAWFRDRQPPNRAASALFRQAALHYVRLHPYNRADNSWRTRLRLARIGLSFVYGKGAMPAVHPAFPSATFESLEGVMGPLDDSLSQPIDAYFKNSAVSKQYAILNRHAWPLVDSFRSLALTFPIALWMLRMATGDRQPQQADLLDVLTAIDRAQGYRPLSGWRHRHCVSTIAKLGELPRLIAWYAR